MNKSHVYYKGRERGLTRGFFENDGFISPSGRDVENGAEICIDKGFFLTYTTKKYKNVAPDRGCGYDEYPSIDIGK